MHAFQLLQFYMRLSKVQVRLLALGNAQEHVGGMQAGPAFLYGPCFIVKPVKPSVAAKRTVGHQIGR